MKGVPQPLRLLREHPHVLLKVEMELYMLIEDCLSQLTLLK